jgi:zinc transport system substrate-binding protein
MKRIISAAVAVLLLATGLVACNKDENIAVTESDSRPIQIITTIFPEYDWVKNILGDNPAGAEITMLLDNGVDLHSYQPTADDIMKISSCDLFIYVGGESDEWVEDALSEAENKDMKVVNLLEALGDSVKEEEIAEGMEHEHEHEDGHEEEHEGEHEHEHEEETEYDEHVWLSLRNASVLCDKIEQAIEAVDPANAQIYKANVNAYKEKLDALDNEYKTAVSGAPLRTLLFCDRFPFRYLTDDYGLEYYAAFSGCSAETEASFETIIFLAGKVDELGLNTVLTIEGNDHSIAETVIQNTRDKNQTVATVDSMQGTTSRDVADGATYISIMQSNLVAIEGALNNTRM